MKHFLFLALLILSACSSTLDVGPEVKLLYVKGSDSGIRIAEQKLKKNGCTYMQKIEAPIEPGATHVMERLILGLKYKVYEVGGNAVISTLKTHGSPMHTYGLVFKCASI